MNDFSAKLGPFDPQIKTVQFDTATCASPTRIDSMWFFITATVWREIFAFMSRVINEYSIGSCPISIPGTLVPCLTLLSYTRIIR